MRDQTQKLDNFAFPKVFTFATRLLRYKNPGKHWYFRVFWWFYFAHS